MARQTLERRLIKHIQDAYSVDLDLGKKHKLIVIKIPPRIPIHELSYMYTTASELNRIYGCFVLFIDEDKVTSIDAKTWEGYTESLSVNELEELSGMVDKSIANKNKDKAFKSAREPIRSFQFLDLTK